MHFKVVLIMGLMLLIGSFAAAQVPCGPTITQAAAVFVNWSQFGFDGGHTGCNPYETILSPDTIGNVTVQWSYPTQYGVQGAPAVANGTVYVASGDSFAYVFTFYALKAETGDPVWNYDLPAPTSGSPAVGNAVVYLIAGHVFAFNAATGAVAWQSQDGDCEYAPTLVNAIVYVVCDSNVVHALNAATGKPIWRYSTKGNVYATPAVSNNTLYVNSGDGSVYALRADTGEVVWQKQFGPSLSRAGQSVENGMLYVGAQGGDLYALDANTGAVIWRREGFNLYFSGAPTVGNRVVYVAGGLGITAAGGLGITALDASTGTTIWQHQVPDLASPLTPVLANGVLYTPIVQGLGFCNYYYTLGAFDAATGDQLWKYDTNVTCAFGLPTPAVVNGMIYNVSTTGFSAFGLPNQ